MATTATNGQRIDESAAGMKENVANLAYDLVVLGELQSKLFLLDLQETGTQAVRPAALLIGAVCLFVGSIPIVLLAIGGLIAMGTELSLPLAWLAVSVAAIVLSGVSAWLALREFWQVFQILSRSRTEFRENFDWIKRVIQQQSFR